MYQKCYYATTIRIFHENNLPHVTKIYFFKSIVEDFFLTSQHFKNVSTKEGTTKQRLLRSMFIVPAHECVDQCIEKFRSYLKVMNEILKGENFTIFLFTIEKFCEHCLQLEISSPLRKTVLELLFPLVLKIQKSRVKSIKFERKYEKYIKTSWYDSVNDVYEITGKFFALKPELITRLEEARHNMRSIAELFPQRERIHFLRFQPKF